MNIEKKAKFPPIWIFNLLTKFRQSLYNLYFRLIPANVAVFEKVQQFWTAKAIGVACELNIPDVIGNDAKAIEEIAGKTGTQTEPLYRLMRALASEGVFREIKNRTFVNTPFSAALKDKKGSMKFMIQHQLGHANMQMLNEMIYSVKTGKSVASKLFGVDIFEYLKKNPDNNELYNKAMTNTSDIFGDVFVAYYDFSGIQKVVDIGGGEGLLLSKILVANPAITGVVFDLPHVVKNAKNVFDKYGVGKRASIEAGDLFDTIPTGGDAYILKNILHIFDDDTCKRILKNVKKSMTLTGKILVVETVVSDDNKPGFGKLFDLQMLIGTEGGKERTKTEFEKIMKDAGLKLNRIVKTVSPFSILEATP